MRNAFAEELTKLAAENKKIVLLSADIGNKLFDKLKMVASDRVINTGVAEANTIGVAAGMAMTGMKPIAYTITPFITSRCIEQLRVDLGYHNQPVLVVGVGSGLGYAELGPTHHSCEDISFLRSIPGMTVLCPADPSEVKVLLREALKQKGPVYMRIGKKGETQLHKNLPNLTIGKAHVMYSSSSVETSTHKNNKVCILNTGITLELCLDAKNDLELLGYDVEIVHFHTVKPLDTETLRNKFSKFGIVATVEEHSLIGGFGSAVAEWLIDSGIQHADSNNKPAKLVRFGTRDEFMHFIGDQEYARKFYGLTKEAIVAKIKSQTVK